MTPSPRARFIALAGAGYAALALLWLFLPDSWLPAWPGSGAASAKNLLLLVATTAAFVFALRAVPPQETGEPAAAEAERAADAARESSDDRERRERACAAELHAAQLELESLAYALTHNLRAPLRAIGGFSHVLLEDHAAALDAEARTCIEQIMRANDHLGRQLEGLLALLRCSRGELRRAPVDVSAQAGRRLAELAAADPQRQVCRHVDAGLTAVGDPDMLGIALAHLLDNAWKFTRDTAAPCIRVAAGEVDGLPGICVSDNGAGFDMAHAEQLFKPFRHLHRQDEFPGVGIGLATVQRIIQRHGGELRAVAAPGRGATFCFSLPSAASATENRHEQ